MFLLATIQVVYPARMDTSKSGKFSALLRSSLKEKVFTLRIILLRVNSPFKRKEKHPGASILQKSAISWDYNFFVPAEVMLGFCIPKSLSDI